jgi:uncharacterized protein (TIGR02246 family)
MPAIEKDILALYNQWLQAWNERNAKAMATLVAADGNITGFDGSQMNGPAEVEASLQPIFANHPTAAYVCKVRVVKQLAPGVALLRAVVGMVPPGKNDINPAVNAIQTLVAVVEDGVWKLASFQNTPAAFHGRPELSEQLSAELREELRRMD